MRADTPTRSPSMTLLTAFYQATVRELSYNLDTHTPLLLLLEAVASMENGEQLRLWTPTYIISRVIMSTIFKLHTTPMSSLPPAQLYDAL